VLADWSEENLHRRAEVFRDDGHFVHEVQFDVSDQFAVRALAERVGALGRLRVLFNTAGVSPVEATPEQIIAVDALGTADLLDEFLPFVLDGTGRVLLRADGPRNGRATSS
jgi:NAD(P)-dependent dehydrogenase (short-subunit alcohol dehydrogenase family)